MPGQAIQKATVVGPSFLVLDHQLEPLQELKLTSYDAPPEAWTASVDTEGACWSEWPIRKASPSRANSASSLSQPALSCTSPSRMWDSLRRLYWTSRCGTRPLGRLAIKRLPKHEQKRPSWFRTAFERLAWPEPVLRRLLSLSAWNARSGSSPHRKVCFFSGPRVRSSGSSSLLIFSAEGHAEETPYLRQRLGGWPFPDRLRLLRIYLDSGWADDVPQVYQLSSPPPLCFPLFWPLALLPLFWLCYVDSVDGCVVLLASHLTLRHFIISFVCPEHRK